MYVFQIYVRHIFHIKGKVKFIIKTFSLFVNFGSDQELHGLSEPRLTSL